MKSFFSSKYTPESLYQLTTPRERRSFGWDDAVFISNIKNSIKDSIVNHTYSFKLKKDDDLVVNAYPKKNIDGLCQDLILRRMYHDICDRLHVGQSNRNKIVRQLSILMSSSKPFYSIRLDIHSFYESIDREQLFSRIKRTCKVNPITIQLLEILFENPLVASLPGLPRGLSISSAMAEYDLKYFDYDIQKMSGVFYYARFVDDCIIFCSSKSSQSMVYSRICKMLMDLGLTVNPKKTYTIDSATLSRNHSLEYLGYSLWRDTDGLQIGIAYNKIGKIKTRITKSFINIAKSKDFLLLKNRIRFLSGNCRLHKADPVLPLMSGIFYNYKYLTEKGYDDLRELDRFYQRILHCRSGKLGSIIASNLSPAQIKDLEKLSFSFGFKNRIKVSFSSRDINRISGCWK